MALQTNLVEICQDFIRTENRLSKIDPPEYKKIFLKNSTVSQMFDKC